MRDVLTEVAGEFICNECGRNSYFCWTRMSVNDLVTTVNDENDEEDECEAGIDSGDEDTSDSQYDNENKEGFIYTEPSKVRCDHCGKIYEVCNDPDSEHPVPHKIETTETFQAAEFVCLDCNELNHLSLMIPNDHEHQEEEVYPTWVLYPTKVKCKKCKAEFRPIGQFEDGEEEDFEEID